MALYREANKPAGDAFFPWYQARCARPVDIVECSDGSWGVRMNGRYQGHVARTPTGRYSAWVLDKSRARAFKTFRRACEHIRAGHD